MKMETKKYIQPVTDVVPLSTQKDVMIEGDPTQSTTEQLGNTFHFDDTFDDGLENAYIPHQVNPWDE